MTDSDDTFESEDQRGDMIRQDYELVPVDPGDDVDFTLGTIARGQEALNQILDNLPSILFGAAKGKIAESVARAQNIMSEATARIEELRLKKDKQNHDREESLKRLDLEKEELETRLKIDRANALSDGITKIANGAAKLADAGLSKAHIKRVVEDALEKLHVTLDDANGLNPPNF